MKAIGYWFPFAYYRIIGWILSGRVRGGFQLLKGYNARDIKHGSPELKDFVKAYQKQISKSYSKLKNNLVGNKYDTQKHK